MTEKRFYLLNYNNYPIYDSLNDKEYNAQFKAQREKLCLLLNELHEENKRLKSINQDYCNYIGDFEDDFIRLTEENKKLKSENNMLKVTIGRNEAHINRLTHTSKWR